MVKGFSEGVTLEMQSENVGGDGMGEGTEICASVSAYAHWIAPRSNQEDLGRSFHTYKNWPIHSNKYLRTLTE